MKKHVIVAFIIAVSILGVALILVGGCKKKKKKLYMPPGAGTGTGTSTGTGTGTGTGAPPGSLAWAKRAGGTNLDEGLGVSALADGSAFVTGRFHFRRGRGKRNSSFIGCRS